MVDRKPPIFPISSLGSCIPAVKIIDLLELGKFTGFRSGMR